MNGQLDMADGWRVLVWGSCVRIAFKARAASFASTVTMFPALYSCEIWHERWLGHGRRLEGLGFGIECAHRTQSRVKRVQRALRAPFPCFLPYTAVKFGMNIQLDMADYWTYI